MVRSLKITVPVNEQEKRLIKSQAALNRYKSTAAYMRDRALETDISNKAQLAILLTWLSSKIGDFSKDKSLDWTRKKKEIKAKIRSEMYGMKKDQREKYLSKLESTLEQASEVRKELDEVLSKFYVKE